MIDQSKPQYQSYLLRLWRTGDGKAWRATLEHVDSHERFSFAELDGLCAFLRGQTSNVSQVQSMSMEEREGREE